jgi:rhodanese-related sulfurtransferase
MTKIKFCRFAVPISTLLFSVALIFSAASQAADRNIVVETPESLAVAITIDSENLIELYQSVPDLKIVDSRHREDHSEGYIETSFNLPLAKTDCASLGKLAKSKDQAIVFYCNGNGTDASVAAIQIASECGFQRLFWFRGGFVEWEDKDYPFVIN